ncbi:MAG: IS200/IS605 family transposase [Armatimonadota bacterium]
MSQSLVRNAIHLVYSVQDRRAMITDAIRGELHAYTIGILRHYECHPIQTNSVVDHAHLLFALSPKYALADIVEQVKRGTSKWIKTKGSDFALFSWQPGYAAFSVSEDQIHQVKQYIMRQAEHHHGVTFQEELRSLLTKAGLEFDERHL